MVINKHQNYENVYEFPVPHESEAGTFVNETGVLADVIDLFYRDVIYIDEIRELRQRKVAARETNNENTDL